MWPAGTLVRWMFCIVGLALLPGCGENPLHSETAKRLQGVATVYLDYAVAKGAGPASVEILEAHRAALPDFVAGKSAGPQANDWRTSQRDGEPFEIRYGLAIRSFGGSDATLIACERQGEQGQVLAVDANARVKLIDASQARELLQVTQ